MEQFEQSIFPEKPLSYASFGRRLLALIIDGLILSFVDKIIGLIFGISSENLFDRNNFDFSLFIYAFFKNNALYLFITYTVRWLYFCLLESGGRQASVGKMAMRIKVTDLYGQRISFLNATGRYFGKIISGAILLIGYFMMLWDDKNQTLHDRMAGTLVVNDK